MVVYLDSAQNRRGAPNENFAREVMELFTLGEGHYSEADVKEAARAFTGWSLERETGTFVFRRALHDDGVKTVLGRDRPSRRRRGARHPARAARDRRNSSSRSSGASSSRPIRIRARSRGSPAASANRATRSRSRCALLLTSDAFYAPGNRGVLVKSPVELVVGTLRQLEPRRRRPRCRSRSPPRAWARTCCRRRTSRAGPAAKRGSTRRHCSRGSSSSIGSPAGVRAHRSRCWPSRTPSGAPRCRALACRRGRREGRARSGSRARSSADSRASTSTARAGSRGFPARAAPERGRAAQRLLLAVAPLEAPDCEADSRTLVHAIVLDAGLSAQVTSEAMRRRSFPPRRGLRPRVLGAFGGRRGHCVRARRRPARTTATCSC